MWILHTEMHVAQSLTLSCITYGDLTTLLRYNWRAHGHHLLADPFPVCPRFFYIFNKKSSILFVYYLFNSLLLPYVMVNKDYQNLRFAIAHESKK